MYSVIRPNTIGIVLLWDGLGLVTYYQNVKSFNAGVLTDFLTFFWYATITCVVVASTQPNYNSSQRITSCCHDSLFHVLICWMWDLVCMLKVRFLLDAKSPEGKENTDVMASAVQCSDDGQRPLPTRADNIPAVGGTVSNAGNLSNHAKIITEVLKKYPHLVKNNKNIRLKIMQRGGAQVTPVVPMDGDASKVPVNLFCLLW